MVDSDIFWSSIKELEKHLKEFRSETLEVAELYPIPNFGDDIKESDIFIILEGPDDGIIPAFLKESKNIPDSFIPTAENLKSGSKVEVVIPQHVQAFLETLLNEFSKKAESIQALSDVEFSLLFESKSRISSAVGENTHLYFR